MIKCEDYDYRESANGDDLKHAECALGETADVREKSLSEIKKFLKENSHIKAKTDNLSILYFLRSCKFNVEKTKKKIIKHFKMRAERTEWFSNRNPLSAEIKQLLDLGVFLPLRAKDEHNRQVVIIRTAVHDPKYSAQNDVLKTAKMVLDFLLSQNELISIYGVHAIFDMEGVTYHHGLAMTPRIIKRSVQTWESYPCRVGMLEFINAPSYLNIALDIFKSFMTRKVKERVIIRRGLPTGDYLPVDIGGKTEDYKTLTNYWKNVIQENVQWFEEDDQFKSVIDVDESVFDDM